LTITSGGISSNVVTALTGVDLTKFVVSGAQDFSVTNALTDSVSLATVDASGLTGLDTTFSLNASVSTKAMTVTLGAGVEGTAGGTVNTITTGYGADTVTGGEYKDVITTGAGADSVVAGAGNDVISTGLGDDNVDGGAGDDDISDSTGNDVLAGGDGNDTIDGGTGNDTITGGAGNDKIYISALTDDVNVDGGAGTDTLSANSIATTLVAADYVGVSEDAAPTIAGIETAYVSVTSAAANDSTAPLTLDLSNATGLTTLYLDVNSANDEYIKVNNFGGTSVVLTELGAGDDGESITIDGTGSNALTVTARGFANDNGAAVVATGVSSLTVTGTSYISTSAQTNSVGAVTAANASSVTLSTSGNSTASNPVALTVASLTAANATSVTVSTGSNDTLTVTNDIATTNSLVDTLSVTLADDSTLTISGGDIDLKSSAVQTATITVGTGATVSAVDLEAATVTTLTATLSAASTTSLDLNAAITKGTVTMSSGSTWTLDTAGAAGSASSLTISGRGDVAEGTQIDLVGTNFTFDAGSLIDGDGLLLTGAALTGKLTATGTSGPDTIVGAALADTISGGLGADNLTGAAGADSINVGAADGAVDIVFYTATGQTLSQTSSWATFATATDVSAADVITGLGNSDKIDLTGAYDVAADVSAFGAGSALGANTAANYALVSGAYDASAGTFIAGTSSSTNNDFLVQWADGTRVNTVVLANVWTTGSTVVLTGTAATDVFAITGIA
jgi:hypothetical protein